MTLCMQKEDKCTQLIVNIAMFPAACVKHTMHKVNISIAWLLSFVLVAFTIPFYHLLHTQWPVTDNTLAVGKQQTFRIHWNSIPLLLLLIVWVSTFFFILLHPTHQRSNFLGWWLTHLLSIVWAINSLIVAAATNTTMMMYTAFLCKAIHYFTACISSCTMSSIVLQQASHII